MVVDAGLAVVVADAGVPSPTAGLQITEVPPVASSSTTSPTHMDKSPVISVSMISTVTVTDADAVPHAFESSTV